MKTCATCKHFFVGAVDPASLKRSSNCHRYPPKTSLVPTPQGMATVTIRPVVTDKDACGEYSQKIVLKH